MTGALLPTRIDAEHSMVMPAIRRRWTVSDVRALTNASHPWPRYELIDGELLVTPAPGSIHQIAVTEIWSILDAFLQREAVGLALVSPADLELKRGTITQPDVFVVPRTTRIAGDALAWSDVKSLRLAVEVLSASTVGTDRVAKRDLYLESGVDEYWIVDLEGRLVERWTPAQESPVIARDRLTWRPAVEALEIDLVALFRRVFTKASMFVPRD
jgi:Uma2 family endonuclease